MLVISDESRNCVTVPVYGDNISLEKVELSSWETDTVQYVQHV